VDEGGGLMCMKRAGGDWGSRALCSKQGSDEGDCFFFFFFFFSFFWDWERGSEKGSW